MGVVGFRLPQIFSARVESSDKSPLPTDILGVHSCGLPTLQKEQVLFFWKFWKILPPQQQKHEIKLINLKGCIPIFKRRIIPVLMQQKTFFLNIYIWCLWL